MKRGGSTRSGQKSAPEQDDGAFGVNGGREVLDVGPCVFCSRRKPRFRRGLGAGHGKTTMGLPITGLSLAGPRSSFELMQELSIL